MDIVRGREESPTEVLEQILMKILAFDCRKVVEAFYFSQTLANVRSKVLRYSDNGCVDVLMTDFADEVICSRDRVIPNISQHHQPVLAFLF